MKYGCGDPGNYQDVFGPLSEECDETNDKYFWLPMYIDPPGNNNDIVRLMCRSLNRLIEGVYRRSIYSIAGLCYSDSNSTYCTVVFVSCS